MKQTSEPSSESWRPCQVGELRNFATNARLVEGKRHEFAILGAATVCTSLVLLAVGVLVWQSRQMHSQQLLRLGLSCEIVSACTDRYFANELNADMNQRVKDHLLVCKECSERYELEARRRHIDLKLSMGRETSVPIHKISRPCPLCGGSYSGVCDTDRDNNSRQGTASDRTANCIGVSWSAPSVSRCRDLACLN